MVGTFSYNSTYYPILGLDNWDVSKVTNMDQLSFGSSIGEVVNWDVSSVTSMNFIFGSSPGNFSTPPTGITNWNVSNVTGFTAAFRETIFNSTTSYTGISNWNVSSTTNMDYMFFGAGMNTFPQLEFVLTSWCVSNIPVEPTDFYSPDYGRFGIPIIMTPPIWGSCNTTPTPTPTPSITPSVTPTIGLTPTNTPTTSITSSVTPTNTPTTSITSSVTPTKTVTPTNTPSVTPSQSGFVSYAYTNLGTGGSDPEACSNDGNTFYGIRASFSGLQIGDILYIDTNLNTPATGFGFVSNGIIHYQIDGGTGEITSISGLC
jgi:hypothetical protein